tara:strand:+ start:27 stop:1010 length:984 start_codon:yes stop_codon:yes gene_type:complete
MKILGVAYDKGPKNSLSPFLNDKDFIILLDYRIESIDQSKKIIEKYKPDVILIGTSTSENGIIIEKFFRISAIQMNIPLVCVEDYPGNYLSHEEANPDLLFVESESVIKMLKTKFRKLSPKVLTGANIRYAKYKKFSQKNDIFFVNNRASDILWIGQPDTYYCKKVLMRILPELRKLNARLLFKAHPDDEGYCNSEYRTILLNKNYKINDITSLTFEECLKFEPRLVITQYSSLAIEASFNQIPTIHLLYDDISSILIKTKGYDVPFYVKSGGSLVINSIKNQHILIEKIYNNHIFRSKIIDNFFKYFNDLENIEEDFKSKIFNLIK